MNIIYLHTHDTGRYIQPYGYPVPTANLQTMAENGVLFRNCFCCNPTCSPSRAAMLSGSNPHSCGMLGLAHRGFEMNDYSKHLARYLKTQGYETALCGVQHEVARDKIKLLQYDHIPIPATVAEHPDDGCRKIEFDKSNCAEAVNFIKAEHQKPFFLSFGMYSTHRTFPLALQGVNPNYVLPVAKLPDNPDTRYDMAGFIMLAKAVDYCVGEVLQAVQDAGLDDDSVVFFTTDHGAAFPGSKCTLSDAGTGVSLIFQLPKKRFAGQVVDSLVSHLDVFPTLCDIADLAKPAWLEGHSLLPLLTGETDKIREEVFSEVNYHAAYEPMRSIRTERYKLIRHYDDYDQVVLPNIDAGFSKSFLLQHSLQGRKKAMLEFYDLYYDPWETNNLAASADYHEPIAALSARLDTWLRETNDPILNGPIPRPLGARVNRKTGLDPSDDDLE